MIFNKGKCDECGKEFLLTNGCYGVDIQPSALEGTPPHKWTINIYTDLETVDVHVCGKACLMKRIDSYLTGGGHGQDQG